MDIETGEASFKRVMAGEFQAMIAPTLKGGGVLLWSFFLEGSPIGYNNPKVSALLDKAQDTMDPDEEDRIYRELMPIFQADLPMTFLCPFVETTVAHRRVRGLSSPYRADPTEHMEDLWLEEER